MSMLLPAIEARAIFRHRMSQTMRLVERLCERQTSPASPDMIYAISCRESLGPRMHAASESAPKGFLSVEPVGSILLAASFHCHCDILLATYTALPGAILRC